MWAEMKKSGLFSLAEDNKTAGYLQAHNLPASNGTRRTRKI